MARVTLADVAARVGVSAKTVSNVVHGTGMVSDAVRQRVLDAIDELGYRPNLAARQLRGGTSGLIALVIPDLREPYFTEFASGLFTAAQQRGLMVLVSQTHGQLEAERTLCDGVGLPALEGMVMSPLALTAQDVAQRRSPMPLVLIGEHGQGLATPEVTHVGIDNVAAAAAATCQLLDMGRRNIGVIGVQRSGSTATSQMRFEGYQRALRDAGLPLRPELVGYVTDFNRAEGSAAALQLVQAGAEVDALFCFSDSLAFGALYTLATHGISVPDMVRVVGFDNIEEGRYSLPPFGSVGTDVAAMSSLILDTIQGTAPRGGHVEVPYQLFSRRS